MNRLKTLVLLLLGGAVKIPPRGESHRPGAQHASASRRRAVDEREGAA